MTEQVWFILMLLAALFVAGIIAYASTPFVKALAVRIGAMDVPKDDRRMHKTPVPRIGGLAIFFGFFVSVLLFADITREIQGILIGVVIIVVLGLIDDITPLKAWLKFIVQILAACVVVLHGVRIDMLTNPIFFSETTVLVFPEPVAWVLTVLWIVAITNAVNLIDGLDGLAVGVSTIATFSMLLIAIMVSEANIAMILAALAGACVGFMPYNMNPAKIFMGDTGATFLGFILATMSIQGLFKSYAIISFAVPFLILGLPIFDTVAAVFRRIKLKKSPMSADRGHVHHKLIDMGFSQKQSVAILYVLSTILGLTAVVLTASGEVRAMVLILAVLVIGFVGARLVFSKNGKAGDAGEPANAPEPSPDSATNTAQSEETEPRETIEEENAKE
ncbi:undecaprenyl/decaprenyl-phosphate alpha-N-acetylglucosaminyl 1-phosphate transferase [Oscillospiraceae bacterium OttesenSCG-928-G22]|nr:undecaprenyl/decaprenyl-phosphate alpha-N-acetylglucosaminyl 1-phosphate transferase [Oscillospiraceae bacterium OttesenSCG-928-G22]